MVKASAEKNKPKPKSEAGKTEKKSKKPEDKNKSVKNPKKPEDKNKSVKNPKIVPGKKLNPKKLLQGKNRKWVIAGGVIAISLALLVIILIICLSTGVIGSLPSGFCDSALCEQASASLKKSAKFDVDPCTDFYDHVCGNFAGKVSHQQENELVLYTSFFKQLNKTSITSPTFKKIKSFHQTCVEDRGYSLRDIAIEFTHGIPKTNLQDAIIYLLKLTPNIGIFQLAPLPYTDSKTDKKFYKLVVTPSWEYLRFASFSSFEQHVMEVVSEIYKEVHDNLPLKLLQKFVSQIVAVAKDFIDSYLNSNFASNKLEKPVNGKGIDWNAIAKALNPKGYNLYDRVFAVKGYTQSLNKLVAKHGTEPLIDFMRIAWLRTTMFYKSSKKSESIEFFCGTNTMLMFSGALGYLHAESSGTMNSKDALNSLAENVKSSFVDLVKDSSWIDAKTKEIAVDKIKKIEMRHVYLGKDQIEKLYETLTIDRNSFFFEMMQNAQRWKMAKSYQMIAEVKNEEFGVFQFFDDGKYKETGNLIYFMLGLTSFPVFHTDLPIFFNYGRAGYGLGQQMGKSMGPRYYNWDAYANEKQLWKNETELRMHKNLDCVVDYYNKAWKIDAKLNLEEHAADIISSRTAFLAMKQATNGLYKDTSLTGFEDKTSDQMFFYAHAAVHCESEAYRKSLGDSAKHLSGRIRVNGPFSLSSDFAKAFGCKEGSKMNPAKKCEYY